MTCSLMKRKDAEKRGQFETFAKNVQKPKVIASITKGVSVATKPRVGPEYQANLPPVSKKQSNKKAQKST